MIRNVLVATDGSEPATAAARLGIRLAQRFDAALQILHVVDVVSIEGSFLHDISGSMGFEPYLDFSSRMRRALEERGKMVLEELRETAEKAGVSCTTDLTTGVIANEICDKARTADLVVLGQRGQNERFSTGLLGGTTESVIRRSTTPVLVCPGDTEEIAKPLLAYDGSQRASHAMQFAADFVSRMAIPLTVAHATNDAKAGEKLLDEAKRYLDSYEIEVATRLVEGHPPEALAEDIRSHGHDMLFLGAYGHNRIVELVLGSTTEYLLRNAGCPVLLCP